MNVTLRQLEVFLAVARMGSFSEASRHIGLSQPALSSAIGKLEGAIGTRLFDRTTRTVSLTPPGVELFSAASRLHEDFENALLSLRDFLTLRRGRLSLAASPSIAAGFLPPVIAEFERDCPGIDLQVHDVLSGACIDLVRNDKVEFAIAASETQDPRLEYRKLLEDRLVLFCPADHPLGNAKDVTWTMLQPYRVVTLDRTSSVRQLVAAAFAQNGQSLQQVIEVSQATTAIGYLTYGLGVTILPQSLLPLMQRDVVYQRLRDPDVQRSICVVTRRGRSLSPAANAFVALSNSHAAPSCGWQARRNRCETSSRHPGEAQCAQRGQEPLWRVTGQVQVIR